jgi:hypothetical protein
VVDAPSGGEGGGVGDVLRSALEDRGARLLSWSLGKPPI